MRRSLTAIVLAASLTAGCVSSQDAAKENSSSDASTNQAFEHLRQDPAALAVALRAFPKGGDLHNHLVGAIYAESYLQWAEQDHLCISRITFVISEPPCRSPAQPAAKVVDDPALYANAIDALSMRDFVPGKESGHDHFFATFEKYEAVMAHREGEMLAEVVTRAAGQSELYLELMISPGMEEAQRLGHAIGWNDDFDAVSARLFQQGLLDVAKSVRESIDEVERRQREVLNCNGAAPDAGCKVVVRYLAQVIRNFPPGEVYAQILLGFVLSEIDPRFVGVNLVAPEDDPISLRDYALHMRMLSAIRKHYPGSHVTLHAGELAMGLVAPEHLQFHIRDAVEIAAADRIGHGVDIAYERDAAQLLETMAQKRVLVEINLTSNDAILGVRGKEHPIRLYWSHGVPIALSTDDEGVSRIDLTHEYLRAALDYDFSYTDLKIMSRNSLEYSFLSGQSLWRNTAPYAFAQPCEKLSVNLEQPSAECATLIATSEKARLQWSLEKAFGEFEAAYFSLKRKVGELPSLDQAPATLQEPE